MHGSVIDWVTTVRDGLVLKGATVLEVGSYNVNGSVRELFSGSYWGVDTQEGQDVDQVADGESLPFDSDSYPVVISTEVLEHVERPWRVVNEMARVCKPGGHVIVTARGYDDRGCFPVHEHPRDYWRFSEGSFTVMLEDAGLKVLEVLPDPTAPGWFAVGQK